MPIESADIDTPETQGSRVVCQKETYRMGANILSVRWFMRNILLPVMNSE
jgi:hypothetical protein